MKMLLALLFTTLLLSGQPESTIVHPRVRILNFEQLDPMLHRINDTVYLVNFWATWCGPCLAEMPAIEKLGEKYREAKFKILLVSLDFANQLNERLIPYIRKNHLQSDAVLLDDPDQNRWINQVDPGWAGDLPFTLIYGRDFRESFARPLEFQELDTIIHAKLKTR
jgi:thiol-disulfide isomerase/thioredoxin